MKIKEKKEGIVSSASWLVCVLVLFILCFNFNHFFYPTLGSFPFPTSNDSDHYSLERTLESASMEDKTVIVTTLNAAWAAPNSIFEVFLESFRRGYQTKELLKHVVVVAMDQKAYERCIALHPHCYYLGSGGNNKSSNSSSEEAYFMTPAYMDLIWRRIKFLLSVVEHGYNLLFTDCDVMWFRNPFPRFYPEVDFQITCDRFPGNSTDLTNPPNGGFTYVKSNNRSIEFYKFWYASRHTFPGLHDQDVLERIKFDPYITEIGLKIRFLDTKYFGGFCEPSKDFHQVCTMHANCCFGLENKVYDLKILLQDWTRFLLAEANGSSSQPTLWTVPQKCRSPYHPPASPKNKTALA